jgi:hypothetical protein
MSGPVPEKEQGETKIQIDETKPEQNEENPPRTFSGFVTDSRR